MSFYLSLIKIRQGKPTIKGHGSLKKEHFLACTWKQPLGNSTSNESSYILFRNSIFTVTSFCVVWSRNIQISVRFIQATESTTNFIGIIPMISSECIASVYFVTRDIQLWNMKDTRGWFVIAYNNTQLSYNYLYHALSRITLLYLW